MNVDSGPDTTEVTKQPKLTVKELLSDFFTSIKSTASSAIEIDNELKAQNPGITNTERRQKIREELLKRDFNAAVIKFYQKPFNIVDTLANAKSITLNSATNEEGKTDEVLLWHKGIQLKSGDENYWYELGKTEKGLPDMLCTTTSSSTTIPQGEPLSKQYSKPVFKEIIDRGLGRSTLRKLKITVVV